MTKTIRLTRGFETIVDDDVFETVKKVKWFAKFGGTGGPAYAARTIRVDGKNKTVRLHRKIMNAPDGLVVDHLNRDTLDNQRANLRICTQKENLKNMKNGKAKNG